jgi:hypothetical protein
MRILFPLLLIISLSAIVQSQEIDATLAGDTENEGLSIKNNSGATLFRVIGTGLVGIGTTSPNTKLHVAGSQTLGNNFTPGTANDDNILNLIVGTNSNGRTNGINFYESSAGFGMRLGYDGALSAVDNKLAIYASGTVGGDNPPELFVFENGGYFGIGVANPNAPIVAASGAFLSDGGVWTNASSREYKQEIQELGVEEAIETVMNLEPVTYKYKMLKDKNTYVGFIAEDVPDLVAIEGRKGLSSMDIVAVLTKVLQEQQKQIEELENKINSLTLKENNRTSYGYTDTDMNK